MFNWKLLRYRVQKASSDNLSYIYIFTELYSNLSDYGKPDFKVHFVYIGCRNLESI